MVTLRCTHGDDKFFRQRINPSGTRQDRNSTKLLRRSHMGTHHLCGMIFGVLELCRNHICRVRSHLHVSITQAASEVSGSVCYCVCRPKLHNGMFGRNLTSHIPRNPMQHTIILNNSMHPLKTKILLAMLSTSSPHGRAMAHLCYFLFALLGRQCNVLQSRSSTAWASGL